VLSWILVCSQFNHVIMMIMKNMSHVKVSIDGEMYEVDSCWSQETEVFCEKIADEVKEFIEEMCCKPT